MANQAGFSEAMRGLVAREVREALLPYQGIIASIQEFMGHASAGAPRSVAAPAAAFAPARRARAAVPGPRNAGASLDVVGNFSQGQRVQYRQGRGTFVAKVVGIDAKHGILTVERESDGKKVARPAAKIDAV